MSTKVFSPPDDVANRDQEAPRLDPPRIQGCTAPPPWYGLVVALVLFTAVAGAAWLLLK
jgi:hypothetical protein